MKIEKKESEMSERPTPETDDAQWGTGKVTTDFARRLERERDEAQNKLDAVRKSHDIVTTHFREAERERERDEARAWAEKVERNALQHSIRAEKAERERDEARDDAAHWKTEYEIVEARLCGWKHPRDNGIIFEHEVIPRLEAKIAQLEGKTAKPEPLWYNQREIPIASEEAAK